jgi:hypothetical protein
MFVFCPNSGPDAILVLSAMPNYSEAGMIPMNFQDEYKARRDLDCGQGASEAHIQSDTQRASNAARNPKNQRIMLILKAHWNKTPDLK